MPPSRSQLKSKKAFSLVFLKGKTVREKNISLKFLENGEKYDRFGISAGLKFSKKSVARNRAKRIVRVAIREFFKKTEIGKQGYDAVFYFNKGVKELEYQAALEEVAHLLEKLRNQ